MIELSEEDGTISVELLAAMFDKGASAITQLLTQTDLKVPDC